MKKEEEVDRTRKLNGVILVAVQQREERQFACINMIVKHILKSRCCAWTRRVEGT